MVRTTYLHGPNCSVSAAALCASHGQYNLFLVTAVGIPFLVFLLSLKR